MKIEKENQPPSECSKRIKIRQWNALKGQRRRIRVSLTNTVKKKKK